MYLFGRNAINNHIVPQWIENSHLCVVWIMAVLDIVLILGFFYCIGTIWWYLRGLPGFETHDKSLVLKAAVGLASWGARVCNCYTETFWAIKPNVAPDDWDNFKYDLLSFMADIKQYINVALAMYTLSFVSAFVFLGVFWIMARITKAKSISSYQASTPT